MPTCVACQNDLLPGGAFCGQCGTPVAAPPPEPTGPPAPLTPTCRCGAPAPEHAFCGECGAARDQTDPAPPSPAWTPLPEALSPGPPASRPLRPAWQMPLILVAPFVLLVGGYLAPGGVPDEILVLWVLILIATAIAWGAGWVGNRGRRQPTPMLMAPGLHDHELVYSRFGVEHGPVTATELAHVAQAQGLPPTTQVRDTVGGAWFPLSELVRTSSTKSFGAALALTFFLGALGGHWFYLGRPGLGALRLVTWAGTMVLGFATIAELSETSYDVAYGYSDTGAEGMLVALWLATAVIGIWTLLDLVLVATRSVRDGDGRKLA